jgi:SAM-dependent methyltransferase
MHVKDGLGKELPMSSSNAVRDNASLTYRIARRVLPYPIRHRLGEWLSKQWLGDWLAQRSPDRAYLSQALFPRLASLGGTILVVGCRRYTASDPKLLQKHGAICWTIDIDPEAAQWGASGRHIIGPIEQAASQFDAATFDIVVLSGVFGFGLDDAVTQEAAIEASATILKPGGLLVLGWNTDRAADPSSLAGIARYFKMSDDPELSSRVSFSGSTHVFDFYSRR